MKIDPEIRISVLVCTMNPEDLESELFSGLPEQIRCYTLEDVCKDGIGKQLFEKYYHESPNEFRWSTKAVFMCYLLENEDFEKLVFTDWDIIFFNDFRFIFQELDHHDVLLTPHWKTMSPFELSDPVQQKGFNWLFTQGLYQAGFIGAHRDGLKLLQWWAKTCLFSCVIDESKGIFADQTHLNLMPLLSERVGILRHKGCNIAQWNAIECERKLANGSVLINGEFPVVFIHFTQYTVECILEGRDELLRRFFDEYAESYFRLFGQRLPALVDYEEQKKLQAQDPGNRKGTIRHGLKELQKRFRITTRIRRFLEGAPF